MYLKRTLEKSIEKVNKTFPVVLVTGARQVGKTTVFENCENEPRNKVSLDTLSTIYMAKKDPELFLQRYPAPVLIDEVQNAPELFPYIKAIVDKEKKNGMFWLTGSQQFHLMQHVTESLAGRVGILKLAGFSQDEKHGRPEVPYFLPTPEYIEKKEPIAIKTELQSIYNLIWRGSYPKMNIENSPDWSVFYDSYVQTYIERDIKDLAAVANETDFMVFMRVLAARTGQIINYSDIAKDVGVTSPTIKSWMSVLETSGLIYIMHPYSNNVTSRMIKAPKVYFLDTGLVCFLTGWNSAEALEKGAMSGSVLETYVVSEIIKSYWHAGKRPNIYYYRDVRKNEIDIILEENNVLYPIEIKKKTNPDKSDIKSFSLIERHLKRERGYGAVICMSPTHMPLTENVNVIPIGYL